MTRAHNDDGAGVPPVVSDARVSSSNTDLCASARHVAMAGSFPGKGASGSPDASPRETAKRTTIPFATWGPLAANMEFGTLRRANTRESYASRWCVVPRARARRMNEELKTERRFASLGKSNVAPRENVRMVSHHLTFQEARGETARAMTWERVQFQHGRRRENCVKCVGCEHGELRNNCTLRTGCLHGKVRRERVRCNPCTLGKVKGNCPACSPCPHGEMQSRCAPC